MSFERQKISANSVQMNHPCQLKQKTPLNKEWGLESQAASSLWLATKINTS
jgi:hypothetical protein